MSDEARKHYELLLDGYTKSHPDPIPIALVGLITNYYNEKEWVDLFKIRRSILKSLLSLEKQFNISHPLEIIHSDAALYLTLNVRRPANCTRFYINVRFDNVIPSQKKLAMKYSIYTNKSSHDGERTFLISDPRTSIGRTFTSLPGYGISILPYCNDKFIKNGILRIGIELKEIQELTYV
eukprot:525083_1